MRRTPANVAVAAVARRPSLIAPQSQIVRIGARTNGTRAWRPVRECRRPQIGGRGGTRRGHESAVKAARPWKGRADQGLSPPDGNRCHDHEQSPWQPLVIDNLRERREDGDICPEPGIHVPPPPSGETPPCLNQRVHEPRKK